jgi:hypothetical protein
LLGALTPQAAQAWVAGAPAGADGGPGATWTAESPLGIPLDTPMDRLGEDIQEFSQPTLGPGPMVGPELMQWAQMMAVAVVPIAGVASAMGGGGGGGGSTAVLQSLLGGPADLGSDSGKSAPTPAPEPSSLWLFAISASLLGARFVQRRRALARAQARVR